jgi:hypothetical protein
MPIVCVCDGFVVRRVGRWKETGLVLVDLEDWDVLRKWECMPWIEVR